MCAQPGFQGCLDGWGGAQITPGSPPCLQAWGSLSNGTSALGTCCSLIGSVPLTQPLFAHLQSGDGNSNDPVLTALSSLPPAPNSEAPPPVSQVPMWMPMSSEKSTGTWGTGSSPFILAGVQAPL